MRYTQNPFTDHQQFTIHFINRYLVNDRGRLLKTDGVVISIDRPEERSRSSKGVVMLPRKICTGKEFTSCD